MAVFWTFWKRFFDIKSHQKRRGQSKDIPKNIASLLRNQREQQMMDIDSDFLVCILCMMWHKSIPANSVFVYFEEGTSCDEVESSDQIPNYPVIAVLGQDMFNLSYQTYIVCENRCLNKQAAIPMKQALYLLIEVYFAFKFAYSIASAGVLQFIEKDCYKITGGCGSRIERSKGENGYGHAAPDLCPKYVSLKNGFMKDGFRYPTPNST